MRTNGFPLDMSSDNLADLTISYQNFDLSGSPIQVTMSIDTVNAAKNGATSLNIAYEIFTDQSGQMAFTLTGDLVAGPAIETVQVNSQWLATGPGEATLRIASGDGAGLQQTECWDSGFGATYNMKPWASTEDTGTPADCPALPALSPLTPSIMARPARSQRLGVEGGAGSEVRCCRTIRIHSAGEMHFGRAL